MKKIISSFCFLLATSSVCFAMPSWLAIHSEEYSKDTSPSADTTSYSAYFCTTIDAGRMFGQSTVDGVTDYLSKNFASGKTSLEANDAVLREAYTFTQTIDYDTYGGQYEFIDNFATQLAIPSLSTYLAVLLYDDGMNSAVRVFGNADWTGGNVTFDDTYTASGTFSDWTATTIPEPTSGMLLLLGIAGLALKRRRCS